MILHIVIDNKFIDMAYRVFEEVYPLKNIFVLPSNINRLTYIKKTPVNILSYKTILSNKFIENLQKYDMVVLHWIDDIKLEIVRRADENINFVWIGWGGDYYDDLICKGDISQLCKPLTKKLLLNNLNYHLKDKNYIGNKITILKKIKYFAPVLKEDYDLVKKAIPDFEAKYLSWNYGTLEDDILKHIEDPIITGNNILLGNSATFENNHLEAFEIIKNIDIKKRYIYTPLSYGDIFFYRDYICNKGKEYFGNNFVPLIDFLSMNDYLKILSSCSIAIMNHLRQQALGNIVIMMYLGAKVFLDRKNPIYNFFKKNKAFIFSLEEIHNEINKSLNFKEIEYNRNILKKFCGREVVYKKTKNLIETVLSDKFSEYVSLMKRSISISRFLLLENMDKAMQFLEEGKAKEALEIINEIYKTEPHTPNLHYGRAVAFYLLGRLEEAKDAVQKQLSIHPEHEKARELLEKVEKESQIVLRRKSVEKGYFCEVKLKSKEVGAKSIKNYYCIFLNVYYPAFLISHYNKNPNLYKASYEEQLISLQEACFGDSDFYSEGLKNAGWYAEDLIINCQPLQERWAIENNFTNYANVLEIAIEQIRRKKPQVVYFQDLSIATTEFLSAIRPYTNLIVGQIACAISTWTDFSRLDIIFSSLPFYVNRFRASGLTAYYQPLAFEPRVLRKMQNHEKIYPVSFIGGLGKTHTWVSRTALLEYLAQTITIDFWGYGVETLLPDSPILRCYHGEAWGLDMLSILHQSFITINSHGEIAGNYASNMRLFEATGCGALLITDYKDNLNELFEIGKEVVAYRTAEECASLIKYYLANPKEAEEIARAGQKRTLKDHTFSKRMEKTAEILERHLRYKREIYDSPDLTKISYGYQEIDKNDVNKNLTLAWQSEEIPKKQRALVQKELKSMYKGNTPAVCKVLADCLKPYVFPNCSILEIGCSSGYYYEILEYLLNINIDYTGVDYSDAFIKMAKDYYPKAKFYVADGANLPFEDERFDIVISGGVLLLTLNFKEHIKETARVANNYIIAHRTPICRQKETQFFKKYAYGVETLELRFNENEFISEFKKNGFELVNFIEYFSNPKDDIYEVSYVFKRLEKTAEILEECLKYKMEIYPPDIPTPQILIGKALNYIEKAQNIIKEEKYNDALNLLDEAMYWNCQVKGLQYLRAVCLASLDRIEEAVTALNAELKTDANFEPAKSLLEIINRNIKNN